jgi:ribose transport system substrate-binding protein
MNQKKNKLNLIIFLSVIVIVIVFSGIYLINRYEDNIANVEQEDIINSDFSKSKKRIVFVSPQVSYPVWLQAKAGFDAAAEEFGFYASWVGGRNSNIDDMLREIDIAIAENVDGIITCPLVPGEFSTKFKEITAVGIPLVSVAVDADLENLRTCYIGSDYIDMGYTLANALKNKIGDEMIIGIIMSNLDTNNQVIMTSSLRNYISLLPNSEIVAIDEDWADPIIGYAVLDKMLTEHPEINAIFSTEGGGVAGFSKVIRNRNLQEKVIIIGIDNIEPNLAAVRDGSIYGVISQDYYTMGYLAGKYAYEKSLGLDVPSFTYTDSYLITKETVDNIEIIDGAE